MVYELFLPDELRAADKEFFAVLRTAEDLPALADCAGREADVIRSVFQRLSDIKHTVRYNLNFLSDLPSVRIIEGKK